MSSQRNQNKHMQESKPSIDISIRKGKSPYSKWWKSTNSKKANHKDEETKNKQKSINRLSQRRTWDQTEGLVPIKCVTCKKVSKQICIMKKMLQETDSVPSASNA